MTLNEKLAVVVLMILLGVAAGAHAGSADPIIRSPGNKDGSTILNKVTYQTKGYPFNSSIRLGSWPAVTSPQDEPSSRKAQ